MKTLLIPVLMGLLPLVAGAQTKLAAPEAEVSVPAAIALPARPALKTDRIVVGTVTDFDTRTPVANVKVRAKYSDVTATTDENGQYALRVPNADRATLYFQYAKYMPLMRQVNDRRIVNVRIWRGHSWKLDSIMNVMWRSAQPGPQAVAAPALARLQSR